MSIIIQFSASFVNNVFIMDKTIYSESNKLLCTLLRDVRLEKELRQQDLAELLSEPQSFVSKYESGERRLDIVELYQICDLLDIPFSKFISRFESLLKDHFSS